MESILKRRERLKKEQDTVKAQLAKNPRPSSPIVSSGMDEKAFLADIESYKSSEKTFMRRTSKMSRTLGVNFGIQPLSKICKLCGTRKHFYHTIYENEQCFMCPNCGEYPTAYILEIRWRKNVYRLDHDDQGSAFKNTREAWYYARLLEDKAECGRNAFVYFIQAEANGYIKIGFSNNVKSRLADLQVACPCKLNAILVLPGGVNIETIHHNHFRDCHSHGEWFRPENRLLKYIEANKQFCQKKILNLG